MKSGHLNAHDGTYVQEPFVTRAETWLACARYGLEHAIHDYGIFLVLTIEWSEEISWYDEMSLVLWCHYILGLPPIRVTRSSMDMNSLISGFSGLYLGLLYCVLSFVSQSLIRIFWTYEYIWIYYCGFLDLPRDKFMNFLWFVLIAPGLNVYWNPGLTWLVS